MKTIRKFLVKNFVLDYRGNIFGWKFGAVRASRIIYPLIVITGYISVTNPDWPTPTPLIWVLYGLCLFSIWCGFPLFGAGYFSIWPPVWEELDDFQKFQYGKFKSGELTHEQLSEWTVIAENLYNNE